MVKFSENRKIHTGHPDRNREERRKMESVSPDEVKSFDLCKGYDSGYTRIALFSLFFHMNTLHRIVSLAIIVTSTIALVSAASGGIGERMGQGMDRPEGQGRMLMGSGMMGSGKSSR